MLQPLQLGPRQPLTLKGSSESGMVFCPQRMAHIAVMRCGEYQQLLKCGKGCPNKASAKLIEQLAQYVRRVNGEDAEPRRCIVCGEPKKSAVGDRCMDCANRDTVRKRKRKKRARHKEKFFRGEF